MFDTDGFPCHGKLNVYPLDLEDGIEKLSSATSLSDANIKDSRI
jgi:hypothetical protein